MPRYTPLVEQLPSTVPFVGPETQERARGQVFSARLGANENGFGPSPKAIKAMEQAASESWKYGDPENHDLRHALADHHGVGAENIVIGEGIDGLLGYLARMIVQQGTKVVTSLGAYPTFNFHVEGFGGVLEKAGYKGDYEDPDALLALADQHNAPLMYFANPDNPMGTWHTADVVQNMIDNLPNETLLALDEAYAEFGPDGICPQMDVDNINVIRFRTFSKAYGMAGARIGYGIAHADLIASFNKVRNHFGVNKIAQAGALAALGDQPYLQETRAKVARAHGIIAKIADENGLKALPTATNFTAIDCRQGGDYARKVLAGLIEQNIFVRMPFVAPQDRCIRVSAGTDADLEAFKNALPKVIKQINKEV